MVKRYAMGKDFIHALAEAGLVPAETRAVHIHASLDNIVEIEVETLGLADWSNHEVWRRVGADSGPITDYSDTPPPTNEMETIIHNSRNYGH